MKKLLSLLSILTISGTFMPTTIAASPYQEQEKLNNDINYSEINNLENLNRNKRDFYNKEKIEFFNNNFFYKFNVNYYNNATTKNNKNNTSENYNEITLVDNWKKYANNWDEFKNKFTSIEFINFKTEWYMWSRTESKNEFKIPTLTIWTENNWSLNEYQGIQILNKQEKGFFDSFQSIDLLFYLFLDGNKIKFRNYSYMIDQKTLTSPWVKVKFDSIRLVGDIDVNPLLKLTVEKSKQFDNWASSKEKELKDKKEDHNYNQNHLLNEENSFKEEFKLWLLQIRHDYIQDLINIDQNNEILNLGSEIDDLKSRLDKLEAPKTCLDNIFDSFKKNTLSSAPSDTWKSIKENSRSPLKIIVKKSGKAFAAGLLTGVAKGSALGIINCVADSLM